MTFRSPAGAFGRPPTPSAVNTMPSIQSLTRRPTGHPPYGRLAEDLAQRKPIHSVFIPAGKTNPQMMHRAAVGHLRLSYIYFRKNGSKRKTASLTTDGFCGTTAHLWSEWRESNSRPLEPHSSALPNCATPGHQGLAVTSRYYYTRRIGKVKQFFQKNSFF